MLSAVNAKLGGMGVSGPFKGSRREWLDDQGFGFEVRAESGRFQLREFPEQPLFHRWGVGDRLDDVRILAPIYPVEGGWSFVSAQDVVSVRGQVFGSVGDAFRWWIESH